MKKARRDQVPEEKEEEKEEQGRNSLKLKKKYPY